MKRPWAKDTIVITTYAHLGWRDRIRALLTGRLVVWTVTDVDVQITRHETKETNIKFGAQKHD